MDDQEAKAGGVLAGPEPPPIRMHTLAEVLALATSPEQQEQLQKMFEKLLPGLGGGAAADPIEAVQTDLKLQSAENAHDMITELLPLLETKDSKAAVRALRLIQDTAQHYLSLFAALGGSPPRKRGSHASYQIAPAEPLISGTLGDVDDGDQLPGGETFANQALQQVVSAIKALRQPQPELPQPEMEPVALPAPWNPLQAEARAREIEVLTRALSDAKRNDLPPNLRRKIEERLEKALDVPETQPAPAAPPATPVVQALKEQAFLGGMVAGLGGSTPVPVPAPAVVDGE